MDAWPRAASISQLRFQPALPRKSTPAGHGTDPECAGIQSLNALDGFRHCRFENLSNLPHCVFNILVSE